MNKLRIFLDEYLGAHNDRVTELKQVSCGVARMLIQAKTGRFWPYSCVIEHDQLKPVVSPRVSISTQAMICASCDYILACDASHRLFGSKDRAALIRIRLSVEQEVLAELATKGPEDPLWESGTYGNEDVFTASWLLQMYQGKNRYNDVAAGAWNSSLMRRLVSILENAVKGTDSNGIDYEKSLFNREENEAGGHSLPLLKLILALKVIKEDTGLRQLWNSGDIQDVIRNAGTWLEKNLYRQLSFYRFRDFRFDAAELIFCLSGAIETETLGRHEPIIDKVLDVVREAQERSVYWRPYRPMLSTSRGTVLLPLSIEVASSLLQVLLYTKKFHKYVATLQDYYIWLASQRLDAEWPDEFGPPWTGWHSENSYQADLVHVWDSALVGSFLVRFLEALENDFQKAVIDAAGFTIFYPGTNMLSLKDVIAPDEGLSPNATEKLTTWFVPAPGHVLEKFSVLVYGPPGTAKTTLAKALACSKNWPLVYLSPSNFITSGEALIEEQAKSIFEALKILRNTVIFFDEIDRLILDRDSPNYEKQGDMFQFMTPSMLTKFNDLREAKRSIFVIATNYEDRIDKAIKRKGRIDELVLWHPLNLSARTLQFQKFIDKARTKMDSETSPEAWPTGLSSRLREFAKNFALYIYPELESYFDGINPPTEVNLASFRVKYLDELEKPRRIPKPDLSLTSYERRISPKGGPGSSWPQRPHFEYACLLLLKGESSLGAESLQEVEQSFRELISVWEHKDSESWQQKLPILSELATAYDLESWMAPRSVDGLPGSTPASQS